MKRARLVVLAIAIVAGGGAAYLASSEGQTAAVTLPTQLPTMEILVAKHEIQVGQRIASDDLQWQAWAKSAGTAGFISRSEKPAAIAQLVGWIARSPFIQGEPIRQQKLVRADGSGFMAAMLPPGMRAVSTDITPETGAGGFILPNDRVDVVLTKHGNATREKKSQTDVITSQVILRNVLILAIDQTPSATIGRATVLGKTATLALKPDEVERLLKARASGALSLALRSIADRNEPNVTADSSRNAITIYRGPSAAQETLICEPSCEKL